MVAVNTQHEEGSGPRTYDFSPVDFDGEQAPPEGSPGKYKAVVDAKRVTKTADEKGAFPMVIVEWKLVSTEEESEACQQSIGAPIADFITFMPESNPGKQKMGKLRYREYCEKFGMPYDIVPKQIRKKEDFDAFLAGLEGAEADVWVVERIQKGEKRISISFTEPKGAGQVLAPIDEGEGEEETPTAARTPAKKTAVNGKGNGKNKR